MNRLLPKQHFFLFYVFGRCPLLLRTTIFQFYKYSIDPIFPAACGAAAAAAGCYLTLLLRCFLLLLLCSRCTAAANATAAAVGDGQLLPSPAAGCYFRCSAARGCHDRASAPAAATLAAAAAAAGFWAGQ